jgi:hypothetical protein
MFRRRRAPPAHLSDYTCQSDTAESRQVSSGVKDWKNEREGNSFFSLRFSEYYFLLEDGYPDQAQIAEAEIFCGLKKLCNLPRN